MNSFDSFLLVSPILVVVGTGILVILLDLFLPQGNDRSILPFLAIGGGVVTLYLLTGFWQGQIGPAWSLDGSVQVFEGGVTIDKFALLLSVLLTGCTMATILMSIGTVDRRGGIEGSITV